MRREFSENAGAKRLAVSGFSFYKRALVGFSSLHFNRHAREIGGRNGDEQEDKVPR
jgi:hypothetical protein